MVKAANQPSDRSRWEKPAGMLLTLVVFLLPLKLASMVGIPEVTAMFSADPFILSIITWPPLLFPLFAGVTLLVALPLVRRETFAGRGAVYAALWTLLLLAAMLGAIKASTVDFVLIELVHLTGLTALAAAVWLLLSCNPSWRYLLLGAITFGTIITAVLGVQQYFSGFQETLEYMKGMNLYENGVMEAMIGSRRIFSTFALPNSLGGYLVLTAPPALFWLWKIGGRIEPPLTTRLLLGGLTALLLGLVLLGTASRSAIMTAAATVLLLAILLPIPRRFRYLAALLVVTGLVMGFIYIRTSSRGMHSLDARIDYNVVAGKLLLREPLVGTGWGDFFHDYMALKSLPHKEAPHTPHSFVMAFASQTGIIGLLAALAVLLYPLYRGVQQFRPDFKLERNWEKLALLAGLCGWTLHSLTDVNLQVPASAGTAIVLAAILLADDRRESAPFSGNRLSLERYGVLLAGVFLAVTAILGSYRMVRGEYVFSQLVEACEPTIIPGEKPRLTSPEEVKMKLRECTAMMPWSPFPWATAGRYMQRIGDLPAAEQFIREALQRSPERSAFYYRLAVIQLQEGKEAESRINHARARELFPRNPLYQQPLTISGPVRE